MSATTGVMQSLQDVIDELHEAQKLIADLQKACGPVLGHDYDPPQISATSLWTRLEIIDDRIFAATCKLGQ